MSESGRGSNGFFFNISGGDGHCGAIRFSMCVRLEVSGYLKITGSRMRPVAGITLLAYHGTGTDPRPFKQTGTEAGSVEVDK